MSKRYYSRAFALSAFLLAFGQSASPASAATLYTTGVTDGSWLGSMLSDGVTSFQSQEITLSSISDVSSLQWTGRYCYRDGAGGCLKTGYETLVDDFHVGIAGVATLDQPVSRSADLGWSRTSATIEYTVSLTGLVLGPGTYTVSIWNKLSSDPLFGWYWDFGGDSGEDLSITVNGEVVNPIPLPFSGLLLLGGLGFLGLVRSRRAC